MYWSTIVLSLVLCVDDPVKQDLQQFQGAWKAAVIQRVDGRQATDKEISTTRLTVEGTKFTLTGENFTISGTFTIDPTKTPKTIDVILKSKEGKESKLLGIYQIDGETRKSRFSGSETVRPKQFTPEKGIFGFEWKRDR